MIIRDSKTFCSSLIHIVDIAYCGQFGALSKCTLLLMISKYKKIIIPFQLMDHLNPTLTQCMALCSSFIVQIQFDIIYWHFISTLTEAANFEKYSGKTSSE
jgi:hypothetical protein